MQPLSFYKRQLTAVALMLDEGEKIAALNDNKKHMWVHKFKNTDNLVANRE
jgi:hypothetical protein